MENNKIFKDKILLNKDKALKIGVFTFALGILLYFPMISKWLTNPDGVWNGLLYKWAYGWEDSLGRFGLRFFAKAKGYFILPSFQTIGNLLLIAIIAVLLFVLFDMESFFWGIGIGALLICSPSLCSTLTYYYTSDAYIMAYLFSVLFVVILAKTSGKLGLAISIFLLAGSMSLYQAYTGTAITLCLLYILFILLEKKGWKAALKVSVRFLAGGVGAFALYLLTFTWYCQKRGIYPEQSRGFDSMGRIPFDRLVVLIPRAYRYFFDYFLTDKLYNNSWHFRGKCNAAIMLLLLIIIIAIIINEKIYQLISDMILIILCVLLLPLAFMSIVVLAPKANIEAVTGILMLPHMNFFYIFLAVLVGKTLKTIRIATVLKILSAVCCVHIVITLGLYTQIFQNCMEYDLNRSYALGIRIVSELENLPQYSSGMKLAVGGRAESGNYPRGYPEMYTVVKGTAAEYGFFWSDLSGSEWCWNQFLRQYLGLEYEMCEDEEFTSIFNSPEYEQMPIFPYDGSIRIIDGIAVVKLSE